MRKCLTCYSPNRDKIEEYYFKIRSVKKTWEWARREFNTPISYKAFCKHFRNHVENIIESTKQASKLRTEVIKKDIYQDIQISETLTKNLKYLNKQLESLKVEDTPKARGELRNIISKINSTIELILKFKQDINIESISSEEELEKKILYCLQDFSIENKELFLKRWNSYES